MNLDGEGSREVRRFFCDNASMWLRDYHFDGLRIDAIHAIFDSSAVHFLEQLSEEVTDLEAYLGRRLVLIAESDLNDPRIITSREAGGYGINAQWSDDFHHALHAALTGESFGYYADFGKLEDLAKALRNAYVYDGGFSKFRGRRHGRRAHGLSGSHFLGYLQTHDQVGNRAKGERSSQIMSVDQLKIGAALVLCAPFIPMLFQGEEFAALSPFLYFTNHLEPQVAAAVSEGRRGEAAAFGWNPDEVPDPQDPETFERSKLDWSEAGSEPHRGILEWYRQLIALRRARPDLADGELDRVAVEFSESERWLLFRRGRVAVACNLAHKPRVVPLQARCVLMSSSAESAIRGETVELAPDSVMIVETD